MPPRRTPHADGARRARPPLRGPRRRAVVARAVRWAQPAHPLRRYAERMGWTDVPWYTIRAERFSADLGVDEWFGLNVFLRDGDDVDRTCFLPHGAMVQDALRRPVRGRGRAGGLAAGAAVVLVPPPRRVRRARAVRRRVCRRRRRRSVAGGTRPSGAFAARIADPVAQGHPCPWSPRTSGGRVRQPPPDRAGSSAATIEVAPRVVKTGPVGALGARRHHDLRGGWPCSS